METPITPQQQKARDEYLRACEELAEAAFHKRQAQARYDAAYDSYNRAFGAARAAGVVK
jgi:hypothetical protein